MGDIIHTINLIEINWKEENNILLNYIYWDLRIAEHNTDDYPPEKYSMGIWLYRHHWEVDDMDEKEVHVISILFFNQIVP